MQRDNRAKAVWLATIGKTLTVVAVSTLLAGCQSKSDNLSGMRVVELDPGTRGPVAGVGIEGQDIVSMTDRMVRDMLASRALVGHSARRRSSLTVSSSRTSPPSA